jgi:diguanylate cyclase (GGDEF)-like protein
MVQKMEDLSFRDPNYRPLILIVDDTPANIDVLVHLLQPTYRIMVATSGQKALNALQQSNKPDLILLDIIMPEMNGYEVCQKIKDDSSIKEIPIIFVTARSALDDEERGFNLGAVDYITKPFQKSIVLARIGVHIRLKLKSEYLEQVVMLDGLTDIPNRRALDQTLDKEYARASRTQACLCVMMIDIDHFKAYNDSYGHGAGDNCLRRVAQTLMGCLKRPGDFIARYGGEEFCVVLSGYDPEGAEQFANTLRSAIAQLKIPHAYSSVGPYVSISIGLTAHYITTHGDQPETLLKEADCALYQAKQQGRNRVAIYQL